MALFQQSVLKKYINDINNDNLIIAWNKFNSYFKNTERQKNIINSNETQFQEGFFRELFVNIFGYKINPEPNFNLITELNNEKDSKKADGAILNGTKVTAVIELKDKSTPDLGKVEQQAFGYKNNHKDCTYVIISNFEKLRLYINDAIDFEEFNLFTLTLERFKVLYICLQKDNIISDIPLSIKQASLSVEENVTRKLYADYSRFKTLLFNNIVSLNPQFDKLLIFKKTQKLLDRFLFIFFAEDRLLLPPNLIISALKDWDYNKERGDYRPLYDRIKNYFRLLNIGFKSNVYEIFAYNGGLFAEDDILDNIKIDDDILYENCTIIGNYDFDTDVDVNILGHIFEHSLNEIDELQAELEGNSIEKAKTKRKKDGVFYTPRYITKYIVENTIGVLCENKKQKLSIIESDFTPDKKKSEKKRLIEVIDTYREWLLKITICDPACGSGAFLNQALDFLINEHHKIDELIAKLQGVPIVFNDVEKSILENNLFGVDINEEAVDIARLSLWLRTAQKGRKLNNLSNNIKCGNSLIDDIDVAGDKAFDWHEEFPQVFSREVDFDEDNPKYVGGFDVIIGNPPYVFARDNFSKEEKDYYIQNYVSAKYQINTYLLFIERVINILEVNGKYGLIIPNAWLMVYSGEGLRKYILEKCTINQIINLTGFSFDSVNVETVILISENKVCSYTDKINIFFNNGNEFYHSHIKEQSDFSNNSGFEFNVFLDDISQCITLKINKNSTILDEVVDIKAGLQAYEKDKGEPKQSAKDVIDRPYDYDFKFDENTFKYLDGKDVGRYFTSWSNLYLKYGKHLAAPRSINLFNGKKIIVREITGNYPRCIISTYNEETYLYNRSNIGILEKVNSDVSLKYVLCLLNSSLMSFFFIKNTAKSVRKLFPKIILNDLRKFPLKVITLTEQKSFIDKSDTMLSKNKDLQIISSHFIQLLKSKFNGLVINNKLEKYYNLIFSDFIGELNKQKINLTLSQESEWMTFFEEEKKKALDIKKAISDTDNEIDQMVYKLYDLTPDEIKIVEGVSG